MVSPSTDEPTVRVRALNHAFGVDPNRKRVLHDNNLDLMPGEIIGYRPQALAGGQRQRVAVARAVVNRPKLILADEPTAALDKQSGREVITILKNLAQEKRTTILIVTHDTRILDVADRIINL